MMKVKFRQYLAEMTHLADFLSKAESDVLNKMLSDRITVNYKIDTSAFVIAKEKGELTFYGREGKQKIDTVKRAGADIWEDFITHVEKQDWKKIPEGLQIYTEIFNPKLSTIVQYKKSPKNNMIISYCKKDGKILGPNDPICQKMADLLQIAPPPVIFDGKLSTKQKDMIYKFLENPSDYHGKKFSEFVVSLFVPPKSIKYLMSDLMEGLVFYFSSGDVIKLIDPSFTGQIMSKKKNMSEDDFQEQLANVTFDNLKDAYKSVLRNKKTMKKIADEKDKDLAYIRLATALTGSIVAKRGRKYVDFDVYKDSQEQKKFSSITHKFVPKGFSQLTKKIWWAEDVFVRLLFGLRKDIRVSKNRGITPERKAMINTIIADMKDKGIHL